MKFFFSIYIVITSYLYYQIQKEKTLEESISDGKIIYQDFCIQCHLGSGEGVAGTFPPLNKSDYLLKNIDKSIYSIKFWLKVKIIVNEIEYDGIMLNQGLENEEIADVMNYIINSWENNLKIKITEKRVSQVIKWS